MRDIENNYPTPNELNKIKRWNILNDKEILVFLSYIEELWWMPDWGFKLKGKKVISLELHTGGWSGNEEIISALKSNFMFWGMFWQKSIRGGHYYFKIPMRYFKK